MSVYGVKQMNYTVKKYKRMIRNKEKGLSQLNEKALYEIY